MDQLKAATATAHARTEAALPSMEDLATSRGYRWYLTLLHDFHAAWEPQIWSAIGAGAAELEPALRRKLPALDRDVISLGVRAASASRPPLASPIIPSSSFALGALYVLEGASLGGRIIERRIAGTLSITPTDGGEYLHGYGDDTSSCWKRFGQIMNSRVNQLGERDTVIEGALACFGALERWITIQSVGDAQPPVAAADD